MEDRRKPVNFLRGEQLNLWDKAPASNKEKTITIGKVNDASDSYIKQQEMDVLSQELAVTKKRLSKLQKQLEKEKIRNDENRLVYLRKLTPRLPALLLFEVLKTMALKETREMIKPLKPTVGMVITTNQNIKKIGKTIGLSPSGIDAALKLLLNTGFVQKSMLGALELGQFSHGKKGSILPAWYKDINNPEHIMLLL